MSSSSYGQPPSQPSAVPPSRQADPAALGLSGFGLTTFTLSVILAGIVSDTAAPVVLGLALAYGGIAQLLAGMWEFRNGNTFGALAFSSYGAFWLSFWALQEFFLHMIPAAEQGKAVALYLIAWGIFTVIVWIASFRVSVAVNLVLLTLAATYFVLGVGYANGSTGLKHLGGAIGIATAILAWYTALAVVTNKTFDRTIFPVIPLNP
jgi:succinate-acetate transporter protein